MKAAPRSLGAPPGARRGGGGRGGASQSSQLIAVTLVIAAALWVYLFMFQSLKRAVGENPNGAIGSAIQRVQNLTHRLEARFECPRCKTCEHEHEQFAELDGVNDHPPAIAPSYYAKVHGIEPFERSTTKNWDLHTFPTD